METDSLNDIELGEYKNNSMSNTTRRIKINHEINDIWESGCLKMDRRAVQYFTQIILISGTMIFCIERLIHLNACDGSPYLSLVTMLVGLMIKGPEFKK